MYAGQTGISGSVKIGENLICGGQVGFAGHINIGKNVRVAAKSGVTKNIKDNSVIAGFPATDIKIWKKRLLMKEKMDINKIQEVLPHRYPFLLIDRIVDYVPDESAHAIKCVTINEPFFQGHFPGRPLMPGVLVVKPLSKQHVLQLQLK